MSEKLKGRKHTEEEYFDIYFEDRDSDYTIRSKKIVIVKVRKPQFCYSLDKDCTIEPGTLAGLDEAKDEEE